MKIFVLGAGFVANHLPYSKILDRIEPSQASVQRILDMYTPDVLINCIGKTGRPNVDWCESHQAETYLANVTLPTLIAAECQKRNIHLIQIGSGCIYFGQSPNSMYCTTSVENNIDLGWKETDFANPQSFYSKTKYACDLAIGQQDNVTILRIRMPVSFKDDPRNFINKIRGYQKVIDIPNSMTLMSDLVRCINFIIKEKKIGIYHTTNPGTGSAAQVMREFQKYYPKHTFNVIDENELDKLTIAKRSNCILNSDKLKDSGFEMTSFEEGLKECMAIYIKNIGD